MAAKSFIDIPGRQKAEACNVVGKIEKRLFIGRLNYDWLRLILTGLLEHTDDKNHSDQGENTDESISVGTVKV